MVRRVIKELLDWTPSEQLPPPPSAAKRAALARYLAQSKSLRARGGKRRDSELDEDSESDEEEDAEADGEDEDMDEAVEEDGLVVVATEEEESDVAVDICVAVDDDSED